MPQLTPIQIDENTVIYIETIEGITILPASSPAPTSQERQRDELVDEKGGTKDAARRIAQNFEVLEGIIRTISWQKFQKRYFPMAIAP